MPRWLLAAIAAVVLVFVIGGCGGGFVTDGGSDTGGGPDTEITREQYKAMKVDQTKRAKLESKLGEPTDLVENSVEGYESVCLNYFKAGSDTGWYLFCFEGDSPSAVLVDKSAGVD